MFGLFEGSRQLNTYEPAIITESASSVANPLRGWYSIFYFVLREDTDWIDVERRLSKSDCLAMVFLDIGAVSCESITEEDEKEIRKILDYFSEREKDVILRVAYDHEGLGMEREPGKFAFVEEHAQKMVEIINDYQNIFVIQGLMTGNWGEMHSSKYLKEECLEKIADIFSACENSYLSVRKPVQWRNLNKHFGKDGLQTYRKMGLFDDAMFSSETDMGTFSLKSKNEVGYREGWCRNEEIEFFDVIGKKNPVGGEVVYGEGYYDKIGFGRMKDDMAKMHVTYLDIEYDEKMIESWKNSLCSENGIWTDKSQFEYIDAHLGYRFVVESVKVRKNREKRIVVEATVCNKGFAPIYGDADVVIEIDDGENLEYHKIKKGLNNLLSGEKRTVCATFKMTKGFIGTYGRIGNRTIEFANENNSDKITLLGELL